MTNALSPLDGRYAGRVEELRRLMGEEALTRARVHTELAYFTLLCTLRLPHLAPLTVTETALLEAAGKLTDKDLGLIDVLEKRGYKKIPATNHDVKAIEYFLKEKLSATSLKNRLEWIHFGLTSEDINSVSYALLLSDALGGVLLPTLGTIQQQLVKISKKYARAPMLARTHGQPAVPTTFGKEMGVFAYRLRRQLEQLKSQQISCKFSGAVGAYHAQQAAASPVNWPGVSRKLVAQLNKGRKIKLFLSELTTQVDGRDSYAELFDNLRRIHVILLGLCQDLWHYTSDGWLGQKAVAGEVGSSTMPQKINPIDFENAEGNLGLSNALLRFFSEKLPVSRLQRDLSDSTVLRNMATAFGYAQVAYCSLLKGLSKTVFNAAQAKADLLAHPEVVAEALQTILRAEGVAQPYEKLKALTRGRVVTQQDLSKFIDELDIHEKTKKRLRAVTVLTYLGLSARLAGGVK